jgi:hypothetical protein
MHFPKLLLLYLSAITEAFELTLECTDGIMSTPTYNTAGAIFTACANNTINGAPSLVFDILLDFRKYHKWNTFIYDAEVPANVTDAKDVYVGSK